MSQTIGHGSQFEIETTPGSGTFTTIAGTVSIDFGSNKIDAVENTEMATSGVTRSYLGGLEDPGDVTLKLNVKPGDATQTFLFACKDTALHNMKAIYPGATRTKAFAGIILSIDEAIPDDKLPTYAVKIKVTGPITIS